MERFTAAIKEGEEGLSAKEIRDDFVTDIQVENHSENSMSGEA